MPTAILQAQSRGAVQTAHSRGGRSRNRGSVLARIQQAGGLSPDQAQNAATVIRVGKRMGATPKEMLAAIETGLVESGFTNYTNQALTDADSLGWRQERTSQYGTGPKGPTNVAASARRFFNEVRTDPGTQNAPTPGLLAQAAQGSAFPEKYDQQAGLASKILKAALGGKVPRQLSTSEMYYDPGINLSENQPTSGVGGHTDHLHFASTRPRDILRVAKLAQKFGNTNIGENVGFDGVPITSGHADRSFHYREMPVSNKLANSRLARQVGFEGDVIGQALDISGGNLDKLNRRIAALSGAPMGAPGTLAATSGGLYGSVGGTEAPSAPPRAMPNRQSAGGGGASSALAARAPLPGADLAGAPQGSATDLLAALASAGSLKPKRRRQPRRRVGTNTQPPDPYLLP